MENLNQIESDILNKIRNVKDRNTYDIIKSEIFGKKGIITELFKKLSFEAYSFLSPWSKLPIFLNNSVIIPFLPKISLLTKS